MTPHPNLVSDSRLVNDAIALLRSFGGKASAVSIIDFVMKIRRPDPGLAKKLVADLIERDPRLVLNGDLVELTPDEFDQRELDGVEFVVFDLETTHSNTPPGRVMEIGAYRVRDGKVVDEFITLVNPDAEISPFVVRLTGITQEMVATAPRFSEIVTEVLSFIGDSVLVAHNSGFDMRFLNHEVSRIYPDHRLGNPCLCTVQLSRKLLPQIENHKLKTIANHYEIDLRNHHRAWADAHATAHIFINLLTRLRETGVNDLASVRRIGSRRQRYARQHGG